MSAIVSGFQHVAVLTNDLDRLIAFYEEVFEAGPVVVLHAEGAPFTRHALIQLADGVVLHPFERPDVDLDGWGDTLLHRGRIDHYAIRVRDRAAFDLVRERLIARGATDGEVTDFGALLSVGFDDPDGARLEVCWPKPGVPLDAVREPDGFSQRMIARMS